MVRRRGLGRGLDALIGDRESRGAASPTQGGRLLELSIDAIQRGSAQPRQELDATGLKELSRSIQAQGLVQPVVVRKAGTDRYELIAGERRWQAARLAGLRTIPALLREADDRSAACLALVENIQRRDLNPVEEAGALQRLVREFGMTHDALAVALGRSRAAVSNLLRLLGLAPDALELLRQERISAGHAKVLLALPRERQEPAARTVSERELSVRATERLVRAASRPGRDKSGTGAAAAGGERDPNILKEERRLSERLAARVRIRHHETKGSGSLQIHYNSLAELEGILERIQ